MNENKSWKQLYNEKLCTGEEAVSLIKDGQRVFICLGAGRPEHVIRAMTDNYKNYNGVRIMHGYSLGKADYLKSECEGHFIYDGIFLSGSTRLAVNSGKGEYYPNYYSELGRMISEGLLPVDVYMVQTSPPDSFGYCSCGTSGDVLRQCVESASVVIVQINERMPRCFGDNLIHVSEMTAIVEHTEPLPVLEPPKITDVELKIGEYCASLIEDGSTLQLGIGAVPDAVCRSLHGKKDLGIYTEMFSDGVMELCKSGVITGRRKSFGKGIMTADFVLGTEELYEFINNNPAVEIGSAQTINDPFRIAECSNMVAVNTCIEIDLMGQVVSSSAGTRQISGTGGQLDFVRGASLSKDRKGKSIIAMTSTREKNGIVSSRIVPVMAEGSAVTLTRQDVHFVVTEYGIADLRYKTLKERGRALISIAHPDFREPLRSEFELRYGVKCPV